MQKLFNKILVPVDFSSRSKIAVEKAAEFAKQYDCNIYLLHVVTTSPFALIAMAEGHMSVPYPTLSNYKELNYQLEKLCNHVKVLCNDSIKINYKVIKGTWDDVVIDFVNEHLIDLVLIGQKGRALKRRRMVLNPDKIAERTNIPVVTLPSNRRLTRLYSIIIPVTDFLPVRKLMYHIYIASNYNTTINLLGIENKHTKDRLQYFLKRAYHLIRDNCDVKTELEVKRSENIAEAVNEFAMMQSADLVILNLGTQTKMSGFFSSLWGNIIQKYSAPPILTINPA